MQAWLGLSPFRCAEENGWFNAQIQGGEAGVISNLGLTLDIGSQARCPIQLSGCPALERFNQLGCRGSFFRAEYLQYRYRPGRNAGRASALAAGNAATRTQCALLAQQTSTKPTVTTNPTRRDFSHWCEHHADP